MLGLLFLFTSEYPNGTGSRLKICRLNCLRVQIPSPTPGPLAQRSEHPAHNRTVQGSNP